MSVFFKKKNTDSKVVIKPNCSLKEGKQVWFESHPGAERQERFFSKHLETLGIPWESCFVESADELRKIQSAVAERDKRSLCLIGDQQAVVLSFQNEIDKALVHEGGSQGVVTETQTRPFSLNIPA